MKRIINMSKTLALQGIEPNGGGALSSNVSKLVRKKLCNFTLAEVLITLGIIGVVAALTLPSVINNFREKQLET